ARHRQVWLVLLRHSQATSAARAPLRPVPDRKAGQRILRGSLPISARLRSRGAVLSGRHAKPCSARMARISPAKRKHDCIWFNQMPRCWHGGQILLAPTRRASLAPPLGGLADGSAAGGEDLPLAE